jgi:hypothetical protein
MNKPAYLGLALTGLHGHYLAIVIRPLLALYEAHQDKSFDLS